MAEKKRMSEEKRELLIKDIIPMILNASSEDLIFMLGVVVGRSSVTEGTS